MVSASASICVITACMAGDSAMMAVEANFSRTVCESLSTWRRRRAVSKARRSLDWMSSSSSGLVT